MMSGVIIITSYDGCENRAKKIVERARKFGNVIRIIVLIRNNTETSILEQAVGTVYELEFCKMDYTDFNSTSFEMMARIKALLENEKTELIVDLDDTDGVQGYLLGTLSLVYSAKSVYYDEMNNDRQVKMEPLPERKKVGKTKLELLEILINTPGLDARTISEKYCKNRTYKTIKWDLNSLLKLGLVECIESTNKMKKQGPESTSYAITDNGRRTLVAFTSFHN